MTGPWNRRAAGNLLRRRLLPCGFLLGVALMVWLQAGCRAEQPWPLWDQYSDRFMETQGRIVDRAAEDRTTSEGQAYAMFFALVANDRPRFEKLLNWTEANLAGGDLTSRLPAWHWGKQSDGAWGVIDSNPAADADLWMAYTLMEAGRLWRQPRYEKLGQGMASRIAQQEVVLVPGLGPTIAPGPRGFHPDASLWILNPSYLPPPVLVYFSHNVPGGPWASVLESLQVLLAQGSGSGYAMDWVAAGEGLRPSSSPADPGLSHAGAAPAGSYDAIRVYLWLGMTDPGSEGLREMLAAVPGMSNYLKYHTTPPLEVDGQGKVVKTDSPVGFSAAVVPFLRALGMDRQAKLQMDRLAATKDVRSGLYGRDAGYYDQNLALFSLGWSEQRFRFDRGGKLKVKWK